MESAASSIREPEQTIREPEPTECRDAAISRRAGPAGQQRRTPERRQQRIPPSAQLAEGENHPL
jgi:hypothetical protein